MLIHFETHATSLDNETGAASGWFDADLSSVGEEQARGLALRQPANRFGRVFCSDLLRAYRTVEIAYQHSGLAVVRDQRLRECDYGDLMRSPVSLIDHSRSHYIDSPYPNGESYRQVAERVGGWLNEVVRNAGETTVLVIGHRATYFALEHLIRGVPLEKLVTAPWRWQAGWEYRLGPQ